MGISGNMQSLSQLCACYGVPRVTQGFTTLFIGETFAVYNHIQPNFGNQSLLTIAPPIVLCCKYCQCKKDTIHLFISIFLFFSFTSDLVLKGKICLSFVNSSVTLTLLRNTVISRNQNAHNVGNRCSSKRIQADSLQPTIFQSANK